ncbi:MAG: FAD-dependent oxidoreductase [Desulfovibrio sp.]
MSKEIVRISGVDDGKRIESRVLEQRIQEAVAAGEDNLEINALGHHGIGGRLWVSKEKPIYIKVTGTAGQRMGSLGFPGTTIEIDGPATDDVGWLNAGADIIVRGSAANGCCNAMAQGKVFIDGSIGARGMTMTKQNPRMSPPELWVLNSTGDFFAEFMAGGIAVVCGYKPSDPENVMSYRPCVGMVGGTIYYRGKQGEISDADAKYVEIDDERWIWLSENLKNYLEQISKSELFETLANREEWSCITTRTPQEKITRKRLSMKEFREQVWNKELGFGGLIGDLTGLDRTPIPLITTDEMRRNVPVWENRKYKAPCQSACPSDIPVRERWRLIRAGELDKAIALAMAYTPFPATVCGHLCPNLCMEGCTRSLSSLAPVEAQGLGKAGIEAKTPDLPEITGSKVAIIGGGPAGISAAWQLRMLGHDPVVIDREKELGGKITTSIPDSRIPTDVLEAELKRVREVVSHIQQEKDLTLDEFAKLKDEYDYVIVAAGASQPRIIPVPGKELLQTATGFLRSAKTNEGKCGKSVVIIGAGNVGCDVATEAARLGAEDITLIDVQTPAAFGKEREEAEHVGAKFKWPCFTKEITEEGVLLTDGTLLPAETVIMSIGDAPELSFLPDNIATERGHITVNAKFQTTDPKVYAIGDVVRPGLLTQAIGHGRHAALTIDEITRGTRPEGDANEALNRSAVLVEFDDPDGINAETIDYNRMTLEYFDPRMTSFDSLDSCASECSSCGDCRDCGMCETICPRGAISRNALEDGGFEMTSDPKRCIGCGFCASVCPCGIWDIVKNTPIG